MGLLFLSAAAEMCSVFNDGDFERVGSTTSAVVSSILIGRPAPGAYTSRIGEQCRHPAPHEELSGAQDLPDGAPCTESFLHRLGHLCFSEEKLKVTERASREMLNFTHGIATCRSADFPA